MIHTGDSRRGTSESSDDERPWSHRFDGGSARGDAADTARAGGARGASPPPGGG